MTAILFFIGALVALSLGSAVLVIAASMLSSRISQAERDGQADGMELERRLTDYVERVDW